MSFSLNQPSGNKQRAWCDLGTETPQLSMTNMTSSQIGWYHTRRLSNWSTVELIDRKSAESSTPKKLADNKRCISLKVADQSSYWQLENSLKPVRSYSLYALAKEPLDYTPGGLELLLFNQLNLRVLLISWQVD